MTDRTALISGAGAGVGRSVALRLVTQGLASTIAINDLNEERATAVAREIEAAGARAIVCAGDVTDWDTVQDFVRRAVSQAGGIDILVNNAGIPPDVFPTPFVKTEPKDWKLWIDLNLYGVMYCTRAALPSMIERGWGRIITVVSDAARVGEAGLSAYAAGKAGAAGFTRSIAREVGSSGITANSVALGSIKHGAVAEFLTEDTEKSMLKRYVVKRLGTTEDPAALIGFLASDDAEWITGQTYPVNGGFSMTV